MKELRNGFPNLLTHPLINDQNSIAHPVSHRVWVSQSLPLRHRSNAYVEVTRWKFWCCLWHISLSKRLETITQFDFDTWCPDRMVACILKYISWLHCFKSQSIFSTYTTILTHIYGAVFYVITICFMVVYVFFVFWLYMLSEISGALFTNMD